MADFPVPCPITTSQALASLEALKDTIYQDRNEALIERLCRSASGGYSYSDVPHLKRILEITQQRFYNGTLPACTAAVCNLLR
jgi:hypothetical protein